MEKLTLDDDGVIKPRRGRKPIAGTLNATVVLSAEQKEWLVREANANNQSISSVLSEALMKYGMPNGQ